jgi:hypothetical protein
MATSSFHTLRNADLHRKRLAAHAELLAVFLVTLNLVAASPSAAQTAVVHRVNAGGPAVEADPPWTADTAAGPSPFLIGTASTFATTHPIDLSHPSVPPGTPQALFQSERWDPVPAPEMAWEFPVDPGLYEVRLYFADIYLGTQAPGARVFDVSIEGAVVFDDYDIFADVGGFRGVVKSFTVAADGVLDIDFGHVAENPKVSAIEILPAAASLGELQATPSALSFGRVVVGQTVTEAVQVRNAGEPGDRAVTVEATAIIGTNAGAFSDDFDDEGQVTLPPGAIATIQVTFAPIAPGTQGATLEIANSRTGSPLAVGLSGDGVEPMPSPLPTVDPPPSPPTTPDEIATCLARPSTTVLPANPTAGLTGSFPDDHTFVALDQVNTLYPDVERPVDVTTGLRPCWVGGIYIGSQSRDETWEAVKDVGGSAVRIRNPGGAYVAGFQADNHHDAFQFRSTSPTDGDLGDGWVFEHSYVTYNRDDVIENDDLLSGTVRDVLWDGTHVGFSAARDGSQPDQSTERIVFENVHIRLQEMPSAQFGMDHGHLLKWSSYAPRPVIRNSVFFIEDNHAGEWPPGTVLENVTLVWDPASGSAPSLDPMPGLTITTDTSVWENAKQRWLERHGCMAFGTCARLLNPTAP